MIYNDPQDLRIPESALAKDHLKEYLKKVFKRLFDDDVNTRVGFGKRAEIREELLKF